MRSQDIQRYLAPHSTHNDHPSLRAAWWWWSVRGKGPQRGPQRRNTRPSLFLPLLIRPWLSTMVYNYLDPSGLSTPLTSWLQRPLSDPRLSENTQKPTTPAPPGSSTLFFQTGRIKKTKTKPKTNHPWVIQSGGSLFGEIPLSPRAPKHFLLKVSMKVTSIYI